MTVLGKLSVRNFKPKTAKKGKETTKRKKDLQEAFVNQNKNLVDVQEKCKRKRLSIKVVFYLNEDTPDKSSYKKDLDNLLKILMDVIKEEMDDNEKKIGLGLVIKNHDEEVFEIRCHKEFIRGNENEGIDLEISEFDMR
ncbi:hypothetical protein [Candidatus Nitrosotenuis cloacae]|uniref:hypothetical protein n=1 Tax=Candidatus Nitrosotenuis cloacae TaxID=1603555 RepID=UPI00227FC855|nr:hypothetical protein [Candidatus Nitrosotenuis cloacae]